MSHSDWEIPNDENISPGDIQLGAELYDTDFSEGNLNEADLPAYVTDPLERQSPE